MIRVHVMPHPAGWGVFVSGALVGEGSDSAEAEIVARTYLQEHGGGDMVLHFGDHRAPKLVAVPATR
jgi:hypothetical protein